MSHCISVFGYLFRFFCGILVLVGFVGLGFLITDKKKEFLTFPRGKTYPLRNTMMTSNKEMPDKQIRAISEMGKPGQELSKTQQQSSLLHTDPSPGPGSCSPSVAGSREQSHRFTWICCSVDWTPLNLFLSSPRSELTPGKEPVLWGQATGKFPPADCTFWRN